MRDKVKLVYRGKFDAAHRLWDENLSEEENLQMYGKCTSVHGHSWLVEIELEGQVRDRDDMLINFTELKELINTFDHKYINDVVLFIPTAEALALYFVDCLEKKDLFTSIKVRVWESDHAYVEAEWKTV